MKTVDQIDPLPLLLGSKVEPVEYFYPEEKEVGPNLFVNHKGQMVYRPPVPIELGRPFVSFDFGADDRTVFYVRFQKEMKRAIERVCGIPAVEEEKQDNDLPEVTPISEAHKWQLISALHPDGWIPHKPGDPAPCESSTLVRFRMECGYESLVDRAAGYVYWGDSHHEGDEYNIIAWRPA